MILARGDNRNIAAINYSGGFHPQYTNTNKSSQKEGKNILDVIQYRRLVEGSGLVSFTSSLDIARNFAAQEGESYVYFANSKKPHPI